MQETQEPEFQVPVYAYIIQSLVSSGAKVYFRETHKPIKESQAPWDIIMLKPL